MPAEQRKEDLSEKRPEVTKGAKWDLDCVGLKFNVK